MICAPNPQVVVKPNPKNTSDPALQKEAEGERVAKLISGMPGCRVVMLDERGRDLSSEGAEILAPLSASVSHGCAHAASAGLHH